MIAYTDRGVERLRSEYRAELDRIVYGTNWGVAIASDPTGRNASRWNRLRVRMGGSSTALRGAALEQAVMAIAAVDPSLVKVVA